MRPMTCAFGRLSAKLRTAKCGGAALHLFTRQTHFTSAVSSVRALSPSALEQNHWWDTAPHLLSCADCEPIGLQEFLRNYMDADDLKRWEALSLGYSFSNGLPELRTAVADMLVESEGGTFSPDHVILCAPAEGIWLAQAALLNKNDVVVVSCPAYEALAEVGSALGCHIVPWYASESTDDGSLKFDVHELKPLLSGDGLPTKAPPRLLVLNLPHSPTGATLSRSEYALVVEACQKHGVLLLCDEIYRGLERDSKALLPSTCVAYPDGGISLGGVSKTFGLAGLRVGWLATQNSTILTRFRQLKDYLSICPPSPSEVLALAALRERRSLWARSLNIVEEGQRAVADFTSRHEATLFDPSVPFGVGPVAGALCFPKLRAGLDATDYAEELAARAGVMVLPHTSFSGDAGRFQRRIRIGLGRRNIHAALTAWEAHIAAGSS